MEKFIFLFLIYSFVGYIWEVLLYFFKTKKFINRGERIGPWISVYGYGGLIMFYIVYKVSNNLFYIFLLSAFLCGILEFFISYWEEKVFLRRWWDYSNMLLNINGRVCLLSILFFGIMSVINYHLIYRYLLLLKFNSFLFVIIVNIIFSLYIVDFLYSYLVPHDGKYISFLMD